jgi:hypothetical protein
MQTTLEALTEGLDRSVKVRRIGRASSLSGKLGRGKDENTFTVYQGYATLLTFQVAEVSWIRYGLDGTEIVLSGG